MKRKSRVPPDLLPKVYRRTGGNAGCILRVDHPALDLGAPNRLLALADTVIE
jgi:hypothetical protein